MDLGCAIYALTCSAHILSNRTIHASLRGLNADRQSSAHHAAIRLRCFGDER